MLARTAYLQVFWIALVGPAAQIIASWEINPANQNFEMPESKLDR